MEQLRLILAYDQGMEVGPVVFDDDNLDPGYILKIAKEGKFDAVVFGKGIAEKYYNGEVPLILKLNGKTKLHKGEPISRQLASVKEAKDLGAIGVGYTVYVGSEYESEMMAEFGRIEQEAEELGLLVIGWMYPRGKGVLEPNSPDTVAYAARVGLELGADYVKIKYPGSVEALEWAVKNAGKSKVLVSGGEKKSDEEFWELVNSIKKAGAYGMAIGRNVWKVKDPLEVSRKLREIFYE